ncbi:MAG: hypothetical protein H0W50_00690 [Parachlamydiaceae bacterium]|nr:hypothetical protein [Parachlamydiaceae bacterium]
MKLMTRFVLLAAFIGAVVSSPTKLDAYGYQPDSEGYAYADSVTSASPSIVMPLAVAGFAVVLGVLLYVGHRGGSDHTSNSEHYHHQNHNCGHCH